MIPPHFPWRALLDSLEHRGEFSRNDQMERCRYPGLERVLDVVGRIGVVRQAHYLAFEGFEAFARFGAQHLTLAKATTGASRSVITFGDVRGITLQGNFLGHISGRRRAYGPKDLNPKATSELSSPYNRSSLSSSSCLASSILLFPISTRVEGFCALPSKAAIDRHQAV